MPKTTEEEVVLSTEALQAIGDAVSKQIEPTISKAAEAAVASAIEVEKTGLQKAIEAVEEITRKHAGGKGGEDEMTLTAKKKLMFDAAKALVAGDNEALKTYNKQIMEMREKLGYGNTSVSADGGYLIALPEFEAEIEKIMPLYGVGLQDATVRYINSNRIITNKRGSNVTMYETSQGQQKTGTKITIQQVEVTLRKFAAIAPFTDELDEDSAIDFWAELQADFAEEWARILDVLVFTDRVSSTYPGVLYMPGIAVESVGAAITSFNWDDMIDAEVRVPSRVMQVGKWYMHRSVWAIVRKTKDNEGRYQALPSGVLQTPWGTEVKLVDVMPASSTVGDGNEPFALFGDLKRVKLYIKKGLTLEKSNEATVHDADGNAVNLFEKDMSALRAVARAVALVKFPEAFVAVGTGTVS
jgi:HK97 family phage major capsid protein